MAPAERLPGASSTGAAFFTSFEILEGAASCASIISEATGCGGGAAGATGATAVASVNVAQDFGAVGWGSRPSASSWQLPRVSRSAGEWFPQPARNRGGLSRRVTEDEPEQNRQCHRPCEISAHFFQLKMGSSSGSGAATSLAWTSRNSASTSASVSIPPVARTGSTSTEVPPVWRAGATSAGVLKSGSLTTTGSGSHLVDGAGTIPARIRTSAARWLAGRASRAGPRSHCLNSDEARSPCGIPGR